MRILSAILATGLLALAGCTSWNPLVAVGILAEPANKPTPLGPVKSTIALKAAWTVPVGKSGGYAFRPGYEGGRIYAAAADGTITILDEDGRVSSRIDTKKKLSGGLVATEGILIAGSLKGEIVALDLTGKARWEAQVAGEVIAPAAVSKKVAVVRTSDGRIFGLSLDNGKRAWVFQRASPALLLRSSGGVLAIGGDVVAGYPNGKLIALDIDDGKLTWEVTVSVPRGATELERIADVAGLPLVDGANVCAVAFQGKVACFEIGSRTMIWSRDLSSSRPLAHDGRNLYLVDDSGAIHALDKITGAGVWKQDKLLHRRLTEAVIADGQIVVGDGFGFLHVLAQGDGEIIGRLATDGSPIQALVPIKGGLLVQTEKGSLVLVRL